MRKIGWILMLLFLCGCAAQETEENSWLKTANLSAEETAAVLYEKALEEDVLTIYTVSSRLVDVAASFEAAYPGLSVEVAYARADEMVEKLQNAKQTGKPMGDLVFLTNGNGAITETLLPQELVHAYLPYDMESAMLEGLNQQYVSVMVEVPMVVYNTQDFETSPVSNWWELTESQWEGKVYITNPAESMISYTVFAMLQQNKEQLATAYSLRYGKKFEGEDILEAYLTALVGNGLHVVNDSDDVANGVEYGEDNLGLMNASKMRYNQEGYHLAPSYEMEPFAGVANPAAIMMVDGAPNVSCAKLFVRYILGEADGKGAGLALLLNNNGIWPSRTDGNYTAKPLADFSVAYTDESFSCQYRSEFLVLWETLLTKLP